MSRLQKIICSLLWVALLFSSFACVTCFAVEDGTTESVVSESTEPSKETSSESEPESNDSSEDTSDETSEETSDENSEETSDETSEETSEENSEETSDENSEETSEDEDEDEDQDTGWTSPPPSTGSTSRVPKNPNKDESETSEATVKDEKSSNKKAITDYSVIAKKWIWLPIVVTLLAAGGIVAFNVFVYKANKGTADKKSDGFVVKSNDEEENKGKRNFKGSKH